MHESVRRATPRPGRLASDGCRCRYAVRQTKPPRKISAGTRGNKQKHKSKRRADRKVAQTTIYPCTGRVPLPIYFAYKFLCFARRPALPKQPRCSAVRDLCSEFPLGTSHEHFKQKRRHRHRLHLCLDAA